MIICHNCGGCVKTNPYRDPIIQDEDGHDYCGINCLVKATDPEILKLKELAKAVQVWYAKCIKMDHKDFGPLGEPDTELAEALKKFNSVKWL